VRGLTLAATFVEAESGKSNGRPELSKAIALAKRKRGVLVVSTLSRLGRRVSFVANLIEQGIPFACADAPDDEPFILHVKASFAEEEARKISQRTKVQRCGDLIPHLRLHDVRHTTATLLRRAGVPIKDVSTILGHSTVAVTADIYTHTLRDDSTAAMNLLATRLEAAR
jgi:integrase